MCTCSHRESFAYIIHACVHVRSPPVAVQPSTPPPLALIQSQPLPPTAKPSGKGKGKDVEAKKELEAKEEPADAEALAHVVFWCCIHILVMKVRGGNRGHIRILWPTMSPVHAHLRMQRNMNNRHTTMRTSRGQMQSSTTRLRSQGTWVRCLPCVKCMRCWWAWRTKLRL
jgi:hypothetical protein